MHVSKESHKIRGEFLGTKRARTASPKDGSWERIIWTTVRYFKVGFHFQISIFSPRCLWTNRGSKFSVKGTWHPLSGPKRSYYNHVATPRVFVAVRIQKPIQSVISNHTNNAGNHAERRKTNPQNDRISRGTDLHQRINKKVRISESLITPCAVVPGTC